MAVRAPVNRAWDSFVADTKEHIVAGDVFQLVLSHRFQRSTYADPFDVYRALRVVNPSPYMIYLQARGSILVASSPEILCRTDKERTVVNRPLAGTRMRGKTEEEDLGIMEDNCSTDSFVLTVKAEQLDLCGEPVTLALEGINETKRLETKLYKVPIQDKNGKVHYVDAYGLDEISKEGELPDPQEYEQLCKKFNVDPEDVKKPSVIHVLLSARDNYLMSDEVVDNIDGVKLYSGPLGMAFMGDIGNKARKQKSEKSDSN